MAYKIINQSHLFHNIQYIRSKLNQNTLLCAVVKANAYGHGIENILPHIDDFVDYYAVNNIIEAQNLLQFTKHNILLLQDLHYYPNISPQIHYTLSNLNYDISTITAPTNFHIALNTGMNRLGILPAQLHIFLNKLSLNPNIKITGIYSHISDSDNSTRTIEQINLFNQHTKNLNLIRHIASSTNFSLYPQSQFDMVRIGLGLYGYSDNNLLPVMSVFAKVIHILKLPANSYLGYGSNFFTTKSTRIAILDIGYADGLPRILSNNGYVLINNTPCSILGNICMNMTIVDISKTKCKLNDTATILTPTLNANILANQANTIPYEILTNFNNIPTNY